MSETTLGDHGINWIIYHTFTKVEGGLRLKETWRVHRGSDNHPEVDGWIDSWTDVNGSSGVDLNIYRKTGEIIHRKKDHINVNGQRIKVYS